MKINGVARKILLRVLSVFFMFTLILCSVPNVSNGAEPEVYAENGVEVRFDSATKVITISGEGPCFDYYDAIGYVPWCEISSNYSSVVVEEGVTSVGRYYFSSITSIKSVTLPSTLERVEIGAFSDCTSITSLTLPENVVYIGDDAFRGCSGITSLTMNKKLEYLGDFAFDGCSGVKEVTLPETVRHIGERAACFMPGGVVNLPETLDYIGYQAIANSKYYRSLPADTVQVYSGCTLTLRGTNASEFLALPEGTKSLSQLTVKSDTLLNTVNLPNSLKTIEKQALFGCTGLFEITIPDSVEYIGKQALGYYQNSTGGVKRLAPFTIYGHAGNESERYARENGFDFVCLHEADNFVYYPDCTEGGWAVPVCKWCGEEYEAVEIDAAEHIFGEEFIVLPTCENYGCTRRVCMLCGYCDDADKVIAKGHNFSEIYTVVEAPSCTEDGLVARICAECGETCDEIDIMPSGHSTNGEWEITVGANCTEDGLETLYCTVCGDEAKTRVISATGHTASDSWTVFVKSDIQTYEKGFRGRLCESCGIICEYEYFLAGDLDLNGNIGLKDLKILKKVLNGSETDLYIMSLCDLNYDVSVSLKDLKILKSALSGT